MSAIRPAAAKWYYVARHGESRVAKAGDHQCGATADGRDGDQSGGVPKEVFDGLQAQLAADRAQFYYNVPAGPFYGYNRPGAKSSQG
jgi:non-heme chloroperoxidase